MPCFWIIDEEIDMNLETIIVISETAFIFTCVVCYLKLMNPSSCEADSVKYGAALILTSPVIWQGLFSGQILYVAMSIIAFIVLGVLWILFFIRNKREYSSFFRKRLLLDYMLLTMSISGIVITNLLHSIWENGRNAIHILSVFVCIISSFYLLKLIHEVKKKESYQINDDKAGKTDISDSSDGKDANSCSINEPVSMKVEKQPMTVRDFLLIAGLTLVYGVMVFWGLGSRSIPQTYMEMIADDNSDNEIVLDLGKEKEISTLYMHLGHMLNRTMAVSWYDEDLRKWIPIDEDINLEANYNWNEVKIDKSIRYLGIVSRNGSAVYNEIVLLDDKGNKVTPANADDYPKLFDEQDLFPEYLTYYYRTMFDEVYYSGSAYEFLNGMEMYETTHPPMGKILMAVGIALFGVNPFGWRFVCALLGVMLLPLAYWFLYRLFGNCRLALIGTALLSMDFMHYTLSRIATLDSIAGFFILAIFALMWRVLQLADEDIAREKKRPTSRTTLMMLLCAFATGMGVSVKWTGFYAMAGIAVAFLVFCIYRFIQQHKSQEKNHYTIWLFVQGAVLFSIIPLCIYMISFLPQSIASGNHNLWKVMWDNSVFMLNFHENIVFDHPYSSAWYTWCLDYKPLMDAVQNINDNKVSMVATMGNPIIWWAGLGAFFHMVYRSLFQKDKRAAYLCLGYLSMYIPWFFIKRTVFIYQYYGSSLFLCCMLGYSLYLLGQKHQKLIPIFMEACLFTLILFFPVISGLPVSTYHIAIYLQWLRSWSFGIL